MNIIPIRNYVFKNNKYNIQNSSFGNINNVLSNSSVFQAHYPVSYYTSFKARVDKGLSAFLDRNKEYLPEKFKQYTENLSSDQKEKMTPLQAMFGAYEYLDICETADDIKELYPDEPLFCDLVNCDKSKAKRGLLYNIRLMRSDIEKTGDSILASGEDLTVYLVKKIFLEGKTINKINEDLDKDINPVFKQEDKNYILPSTIKSLGIKFPKVEFINSLKYTQEGYSDAIALKMRERWQNLSQEEKEAYKDALLNGRKDFEQSLSFEEKIERAQKRSEIQRQRWENMTPEEKTKQITELLNSSKKEK